MRSYHLHAVALAILSLVGSRTVLSEVANKHVPTGVTFHKNTIYRPDGHGDNWRPLWVADDSQITDDLIADETKTKAPVKIILDTDFGDDGDDLAALCILHQMADLGEVEILAIGQSNSRWDAPGAIDVINTYYGRPDIPIGQVKYKTHEGNQYSEFLVKRYSFDLDLDDVPSAVEVYRRALVKAPDKSVKFVVMGFKSNMRDLLKSKPDSISPLSGIELVKKKVILVSDMGGGYPSNEGEFNFKMVSDATKYYVEHWPTPMIFSGLGTGSIRVGTRVRKTDTPVGRALDEKLTHGWRPGEKSQAGFDLAAVLVAARGADRYFNAKSGCNKVDANGANTFDYHHDCGHQHVDSHNRKVSYEEIGEMFEEMILAGPKNPVDTHYLPTDAAIRYRVIYDCDFGCDGDDMLGLAVLHHLDGEGKIDFLGVGFSMSDRLGPAAMDVVNTYYNRPDFPIGITKLRGAACDLYSSYMANLYPDLWDINVDNIPDAVDVYRQLLTDSPDESVTCACGGYKQNLAELLKSEPDDISPLTGVALVRKKVVFVSDMGGGYPSAVDKGCNFKSFSAHAKYFVENWPTPIIFTGHRWGIEIGEKLMKQDTPVGRGLKERMRRNAKYPNYPRQPSWDVVAALVAAEGWEPHFNVSKPGCNVLDNKGNNWFGYDDDCGHRFIESSKISHDALRDMLDEMLLAPPRPRAE